MKIFFYTSGREALNIFPAKSVVDKTAYVSRSPDH